MADAVALAMKEWALEKGATHFTHWFQPLTGQHRGEARLASSRRTRRRRGRRVQRQGADPGRAGRVVVPVGRPARDVRGPRLHGVGPDVAGVHRGDARRGATCRSRRRSRRGPATRSTRRSRCCARSTRWTSRRAARSSCSASTAKRVTATLRAGAGVLPDRPGVLLPPAGPGDDRPHAVRRQAAARAGAGGPLLRLDPGPRARLHDGGRARAVPAGRAGEDAAQRGGARAVRDGADLRERQHRGRPPAADDDHAAQGGAQATGWSRCCTRSRSRA